MRISKTMSVVIALAVTAVLALLFFNPFDIFVTHIATVPSNARTATVADWEWVDTSQGSCGIKYGGQLTEIGANGPMATVKYTSPDGSSPGTSCDDGDVFTIEAQRFESMTADYEAKKKFYAENKLAVTQLVRHPVMDPRTQTSFGLGWVEVEPKSPDDDQCSVVDGGKVTEIGTIGARVLVSYEPPAGLDIGETRCGDKMKFFIDAATFDSMTVRFETTKQALMANHKVVSELLIAPVDNPRTHKVTDWQWVDIEQQDPDRYTCGIEKDGLLTEIGVHGAQVLVRYSTPRGVITAGTPCDGGEVFFVDAAQF